MDKFEAIFQRRSVRKYSDEKLSEGILTEIKEIASSIDPLFDEMDTKVSVVEKGHKLFPLLEGVIGDYGKIRAPHYIIGMSEKGDHYLENVGFLLEDIVLTLTSMGIGTCWIGSQDPARMKQKLGVKGYEPVILLAFGYCADERTLYRDPRDAKRKDLEAFLFNTVKSEVTQEWTDLLEAVRLAPSAMNSQPWRFELDKKSLHLYIKNDGILTKLMNVIGNLRRMNKIDAGIALKHIDIAGQHYGYDLEFTLNNSLQSKEDYIMSVKKYS